MKLAYKRVGFTLIELLIIMGVLGILSSVFVLSSVSMTTSAEASRIINNLYTLKMATLAWHRENLDRIDNSGKVKSKKTSINDFIQKQPDVLAELAEYIDGNDEFEIKLKNNTLSQEGAYGIYTVNGSNKKAWYVGYCITATEREIGIKDKLLSKGKSMNVWLGGNTPTNKNNSTVAWLKVLGDND